MSARKDITGSWELVDEGSPCDPNFHQYWLKPTTWLTSADATVAHIRADESGVVANMGDALPGRWWLMEMCTIGGWGQPRPPIHRLKMAPTLESARFDNHYYHDFVARIDIDVDGVVSGMVDRWDA